MGSASGSARPHSDVRDKGPKAVNRRAGGVYEVVRAPACPCLSAPPPYVHVYGVVVAGCLSDILSRKSSRGACDTG